MRFPIWLPLLIVLITGIVLVLVLFLPTGPVPEALVSGRPSPTLSPGDRLAAKATPRRTPSSLERKTPSAVRPGEDQVTSATGSLVASVTDSGRVSAEGTPEPAGTPAPVGTPQAATQTATPSGGLIAGAVYSGRRLPLGGVTVRAGEMSAVSGNDGRFVLKGINVPQVDLIASLAGYQPVTKKSVKTGTKDLSILLIQENHLAGRVVDQYGKPVSFASVDLRALRGVWMLSLQCDLAGTFEASNVPKAQIEIVATREGLTDDGGGKVVVEAPRPDLVLLRLRRPSFSIAGFVRAADTGQGIPGYALIARKQDDPQAKVTQTVTAGNGAFKFEPLDIGTYVVGSDAGKNQNLNAVIPLREDNKTVRVFDKDVKNVVFLTLPGLTVSGRVQSSDGTGVAGARVTLAVQTTQADYRARLGRDAGLSGQGEVEAMSVSDGAYRLRGVPWPGGVEGGSLQVFASHSQYGSGVSEPFPVVPGQGMVEGVNITLAGSATLAGNVVGRGGEPVQGARMVLVDLFQNSQLETVTGQRGDFAFEAVSAPARPFSPISGSHTLIVEKEGYATKQQDVLLSSEGAAPLIIILEDGSFIQGRAVDSNSQGIPGVAVTVVLPEGERRAGSTNEAGVYVISGLEEGMYDLLFRSDSEPPMYGSLYQVEAGMPNADVVLQSRVWTVMGTVFEAQTNKPILRYTLAVEGRLNDRQAGSFLKQESLNTPDGSYQLTYHEPGEYRIHFAADGYQPWDGAVAMYPNTDAVQFVNAWLEPLTTTGTITGSFDLPAGDSLVLIEVAGHGAFEPASPTSFVLEQVPAGTHQLVFHVRSQEDAGAEILGVLSSIRVQPEQTTNLGVINQILFQRVRVRGL